MRWILTAAAAASFVSVPSVRPSGCGGVSRAPCPRLDLQTPVEASSAEKLLWPAPQSRRPRTPSEFELNQGRAIDTLRYDYPRLFTDKPDLSIFHRDVELHDLTGKRLVGLKSYEAMFEMLRFARRTVMHDAEVTYHTFVHDRTIRIRFSAKVRLLNPLSMFPDIQVIDGISVYNLDAEGLIRSHKLENIVMRGSGGVEHQSVSLADLLWRAQGMPNLAYPNFRAPAPATVAIAPLTAAVHPMAAGAGGAHAMMAALPSHKRRGSAPRACATADPETPMQRAARERAEDAEKARKLAEKNAKATSGEQNVLSRLFASTAPQKCETSLDCESPMVCCDLFMLGSVCCGGGLMTPIRPSPEAQLQAIPIPVEEDTPGPPGFPGPFPGQSPPPY